MLSFLCLFVASFFHVSVELKGFLKMPQKETFVTRVGIIRFDDRNRYGANGVPTTILFGGGKKLIVSCKSPHKVNHWAKINVPSSFFNTEGDGGNQATGSERGELVELWGPVKTHFISPLFYSYIPLRKLNSCDKDFFKFFSVNSRTRACNGAKSMSLSNISSCALIRRVLILIPGGGVHARAEGVPVPLQRATLQVPYQARVGA